MSLVEKLDEVSDEHDSQEWRDEVNHAQTLLRAMAGYFTEQGTDTAQDALLLRAGFTWPARASDYVDNIMNAQLVET